MGIIQKIFGTRSEREVKKLMPLVTRIESMEDEMKALTDEQLREKTDEFRKRYQGGEDLDNLLPEAFAVCREAADRVLGTRPYRVQLIGGMALNDGQIAEMKTGEGKTLVAILPAYLNALTGSHMYISAAVFFCYFCYSLNILCSQVSTDHCQSQGTVTFLYLSHISAFF